MLYETDLHEPLTKQAWSENLAQEIIHQIIRACLDEFQDENLWPVHPDLQKTYGVKKPLTGLWLGATGTIWALDKLAKSDATLPFRDFTPFLALLESKQAESLREFSPNFQIDPNSPSYLLGYSGVNLLRWWLTQDPALLKKLEEDIKRNIRNPTNEMMWAAPGTSLVAWFLYQKNGEQRWADLFQESARFIFNSWQPDNANDFSIWTQDMYGSRLKFLGLVHGFAGNIAVLLQGKSLLNKQQREQLYQKAQETFIKTAQVDVHHANWFACVGESWPGGDKLFLQLCHGSPGMLIGLAKLWPYMSEQARTIFMKAARLVWDAGPLKKPWGLCHGTAGNGYVFLKCYHLTSDIQWLERARSFAMHAIDQFKAMASQYKSIRTDNWCGDLGLALYLQDCIHVRSDFPLLDYF